MLVCPEMTVLREYAIGILTPEDSKTIVDSVYKGMRKIILNVTSLNMSGLKNPSKCTRLLGELSKLSVNVTVVHKTRSLVQNIVKCWRTTL